MDDNQVDSDSADAAAEPDMASDVEAPMQREEPLPIVGVGASAGGLEAFSELLKHLPAHPGIALVLVQHLDPNHESTLTDILSRRSKMPVVQVVSGMCAEADHVYVIPPNTIMRMSGSDFLLVPRPSNSGPNKAIDAFFTSLAEEHGQRAIGVVLSGTASDGTQGLAAIKARGGITLVQEPDTATSTGMPDSAIAEGVADIIAPLDDIAEELLALAKHPYVRATPQPEQPEVIEGVLDDKGALQQIIALVRESSGLDLTHYKLPTLLRRIERRMAMQRMADMAAYATMLAGDPAEVSALFADALVRVTSFFRDPGMYEALKTSVFPAMVERRVQDQSPLRLWVTGCATGEEPYSIAISLFEYLESTGAQCQVQIFASDLRENDLIVARRGHYPRSIENELSTERLANFFSPDEDGYRVNQRVRESCIFARHDVTNDPPFAKMDMVSCRNLLIYLDGILQNELLRVFHYALVPDGALVLGGAEGIGAAPTLFIATDDKSIFTRASVETPRLSFGRRAHHGANRASGEARPAPVTLTDERDREWSDAQRQLDDMLLDRYAPAAVLVDEHLHVTQVRGAAGDYLQLRPGEATLDLMTMVSPGLALAIKAAVQETEGTRRPARRGSVRALPDGSHTAVEIVVLPIATPDRPLGFAVLFNEGTAVSHLDGEAGPEPSETEYLRQELEASEERLRIIRFSRDTTMEELSAASEEIQSSNEELQSMNEELETAKEELQSTNEELTTLNAELQSRNQDLGQHVDDLDNLLSSASIPIIVLDSDLRIRRYTEQATSLFSLIPADVTRRFTDISSHIRYDDLEPKLLAVIANGVSLEDETTDDTGRWHRISIRPFRTGKGSIDGAVVTLLDIDAQVQLRIESERISRFRETAIQVAATLHRADVDPTIAPEAMRLIADALHAEDCVLRSPVDTDDAAELESIDVQTTEDGVLTLRIPLFSTSGAALGELVLGFGDGRAPLDGTEMDFADRIAQIVARGLERAQQMEILERLVQKRTEDLSKATLQLTAALHARDEFLAGMSHELRTPLNSIIGFSHVLLNGMSGELTEEQRKQIEMVLNAGTHLLALVVDMLDMEKIMAGAMPVDLTEFSVRQVAVETIEMLRPLAVAKELELRIEGFDTEMMITSDRLKVRQILLNIVSNAVKFTDEGEITISGVSTGGTCEVRVGDTGRGMTPEQLKQAFLEFEQVDHGPDTLRSGTGLGLSIAVRLSRLLDGNLTGSSAPGVGSVFTLTLPCGPAD